MEAPVKITLITNIKFIQQGGLRMECAAILIEQDIECIISGKQSRIRGFGPDAAWPTFTLWMNHGVTCDVTGRADSAESTNMLQQDGTLKPLFSGSLLALSDGQQFFIQAEDSAKPLDVQDVTGNEYGSIWNLLQRKAAEYWSAPNMPTLRWVPAKTIRFLTGADGA